MKKSILFAFFILIITIGWFVSGQIGSPALDNKNIDQAINLNNENLKADLVKNKENNKNIIKVETKIFYSSQIDQSIILQGQTIHNKKIDIKSETVGNIISVDFNRGDKISKGDPLIQISMQNKNELLQSAQKLIKLYEIEYSSEKQLVDKGLSSKSKLSLASYNLSEAKSKLKNIQLDIQNTKIAAPFDGIITKKNIEVSDYVTPGNILLTIVNLNPIKVQGYLSEFDVNKVKINTKASIVNANGIKKVGKISFISPAAETTTRTFEIEIEAENSDLSFKSGITTSITIEGSELLAHKIPPSILTLQDNGSVGVKALDEANKVIFYPIEKVKDTIDGMWVTGLPNNVNLIISGQEYVTLGQKVELK